MEKEWRKKNRKKGSVKKVVRGRKVKKKNGEIMRKWN